MTLQFLGPFTGVFDMLACDAVFTGTPQLRDGDAAPPALLLDFMYGAAAYKRWGKGSEMKLMIHHDEFMKEHQSIPIVHKPVEDYGGGEPDYDRYPGTLSDAMDKMNAFVMYCMRLESLRK
jgi:hypothetical protein